MSEGCRSGFAATGQGYAVPIAAKPLL